MAAIEAQACGKPVVCSNHGGLPEVIEGSSGLLFRSGDVEDLYRRLSEISSDSSLRQRFSDAAVANAKRFSWEAIMADLQMVYQS
jgi:D-inositol-3-phosphate glycosyltransferase